jgi:hypothetical protein
MINSIIINKGVYIVFIISKRENGEFVNLYKEGGKYPPNYTINLDRTTISIGKTLIAPKIAREKVIKIEQIEEKSLVFLTENHKYKLAFNRNLA